MNPTLQALKDRLGQYDSNADKPLSEHNVYSEILELRKHEDEQASSMELTAEEMAFGFCESYCWKDWNDDGWGTYYGPLLVFPNKDGTTTISPSITRITSEILTYWQSRSQAAKHPVLSARYAGLVWEFSQHVLDNPASPEMARVFVDSVVSITKIRYNDNATGIFTKLELAKKIALSINDQDQVKSVCDAIIAYEDEVSEDDKAGLWGYSFDLVLCDRKVPTDDSIRDKIIQDLEDRLTRLIDTSIDCSPSPWIAEKAAVRLAGYYRKKGDQDEVRRVLLAYKAAVEKWLNPEVAILAQSQLQDVYELLSQFGLKKEADPLLARIGELGPKTSKDMRPLSASIEISNEEMADYVDELIAGSLEEALVRIAYRYVPSRDQIVTQLNDLAKSAPLMSHFEIQLQDHDGHPVATVGSIENDLNGRVIRQMAQNIQFTFFFMRRVMKELVRKHDLSTKKLTDYLLESALFEEDKGEIIRTGISAYLSEDPITAIHCLVPQIESAIRTLIKLSGGVILKINRLGGFHRKTFDEILRDDIVKKTLGDDATLYFRVMFTDTRGVNFRNYMCHGISPSGVFCMEIADRVVHALLFLALAKQTTIEVNPQGA